MSLFNITALSKWWNMKYKQLKYLTIRCSYIEGKLKLSVNFSVGYVLSHGLKISALIRHDSESKRKQQKSERSEKHESVASPNRAVGSGRELWAPPPPHTYITYILPPAGILGGGATYEKFFGFQRPLHLLKINSIFINCGYEAR